MRNVEIVSVLPDQELERKVYDIVLMDVHMPIIDGLEASRRIKQLYPDHDRPRIVALSADTTQVCTITCPFSNINRGRALL